LPRPQLPTTPLRGPRGSNTMPTRQEARPAHARRGKAGHMQGCCGGRAPHNHQPRGHDPTLCPVWRGPTFSGGPSGAIRALPRNKERASGYPTWTPGCKLPADVMSPIIEVSLRSD